MVAMANSLKVQTVQYISRAGWNDDHAVRLEALGKEHGEKRVASPLNAPSVQLSVSTTASSKVSGSLADDPPRHTRKRHH
jgi:hypothetical protein